MPLFDITEERILAPLYWRIRVKTKPKFVYVLGCIPVHIGFSAEWVFFAFQCFPEVHLGMSLMSIMWLFKHLLFWGKNNVFQFSVLCLGVLVLGIWFGGVCCWFGFRGGEDDYHLCHLSIIFFFFWHLLLVMHLLVKHIFPSCEWLCSIEVKSNLVVKGQGYRKEGK